MQTPTRLPTLYIPHGGGPCFFMEMPPGVPPDTWKGMAEYLRGIDASLRLKPSAIIVISAHWELPQPTVTSAAQPTLLFDYSGFPEHTYRLTYPVPGSIQIAMRVRELLMRAGIDSAEDAQRGLDHGVFVPFKLIYPDATIPVVQLSLVAGLDPALHLQVGRAIAPLRDEGVLIVGSGMSYHNLRDFYNPSPAAIQAAEHFDTWLTQAVTAHDTSARNQSLTVWRTAPNAVACHPRAEHLLPLMVAAGAALGDRGVCAFKGTVFSKTVSGFQFG